MTTDKKFIVGIDALNIRHGGGLTHLTEILNSSTPDWGYFDSIIIWGSSHTLKSIHNKSWITKVRVDNLPFGLFGRALWQKYFLGKQAKKNKCNVLLVPGGSYASTFRPVVLVSQNMLPFEPNEIIRYGCTTATLKLIALNISQRASFEKSNANIFLTKFSMNKILSKLKSQNKSYVIPHGISSRFFSPVKHQFEIETYSDKNPYRILYVSRVEPYKHQTKVIEAVAQLRRSTTWPIIIDLIGPAWPKSLRLLNETMTRLDPDSNFINYYSEVGYEQMHQVYKSADLGIFASSCENLPNILLEMMASGLPVASSDYGSMREILGSSKKLFNPESVDEIVGVLTELISSVRLRELDAKRNVEIAKYFTWEKCSIETFKTLFNVGHQSIS